MSDELAEIRAELKRRGALPPPPTVPRITEFREDGGGRDAYLVILADAMNHLAKSVSELRAAQGTPAPPRIRTIERDAEGNISRIIEE